MTTGNIAKPIHGDVDGPPPHREPDDFFVEEIPLYAPSGSGTHTFVWIEKRLLTTEQVARRFARASGVRPRDVGYAGRKDRRAVTRQWLSVPGLPPELARSLETPELRILETVLHPHKLRTGQLRGNRFVIRLPCRDRTPERLGGALARLEAQGVPNRFGVQRFGRDGDNADLARHLLDGSAAPGDRRQARFLLSALQAEVFNRVLEARPLPFDRLEAGDIAVVHASGGLFPVVDLEREQERAGRFEISPTGPIFGTRAERPEGAVAEREAEAMRASGVDPETWRAPRGIRLRGGRRAFRVRPTGCAVEATEEGVRLCFSLPAGSYATVLLDELWRLTRPPDGLDPAALPSPGSEEEARAPGASVAGGQTLPGARLTHRETLRS